MNSFWGNGKREGVIGKNIFSRTRERGWCHLALTKAQKIRKAIKTDLLTKLEKSGKTESFWVDLVEDYCSFWDIKESLMQNIRKNGTIVQYNNGGGQTGYKKNDAVVEVNKISKRMTEILNALKVDEPKVEEEGDDV